MIRNAVAIEKSIIQNFIENTRVSVERESLEELVKEENINEDSHKRKVEGEKERRKRKKVFRGWMFIKVHPSVHTT